MEQEESMERRRARLFATDQHDKRRRATISKFKKDIGAPASLSTSMVNEVVDAVRQALNVSSHPPETTGEGDDMGPQHMPSTPGFQDNENFDDTAHTVINTVHSNTSL